MPHFPFGLQVASESDMTDPIVAKHMKFNTSSPTRDRGIAYSRSPQQMTDIPKKLIFYSKYYYIHGLVHYFISFITL